MVDNRMSNLVMVVVVVVMVRVVVVGVVPDVPQGRIFVIWQYMSDITGHLLLK